MYARVSKKGQITIPKSIRQRLKIDKGGGVLFLLEDDEVKLKGVPGGNTDQLAGSLKKYAKAYATLNKIRAKIIGKVADEAVREGISD